MNKTVLHAILLVGIVVAPFVFPDYRTQFGDPLALYHCCYDLGHDRRSDGLQFAGQHLLLRNRNVCRSAGRHRTGI